MSSSSSVPTQRAQSPVNDRISQLSAHRSDGLAAPAELIHQLHYLIRGRNMIVHDQAVNTLPDHHRYVTTWIAVRRQLTELLREWHASTAGT